MIHDPTIEVTCDGPSCYDSIEIEPEFRYADYSGNNGEYDTSERALNRKIEAEDWLVQGDKHYCEDCARDVQNES